MLYPKQKHTDYIDLYIFDIFEQCKIQNRVIMNLVIKGLVCMST